MNDEIFTFLKDKFGWNLTNSLSETGRKLVNDTIIAKEQIDKMKKVSSLKKRFKTALFHFFKDEILKEVCAETNSIQRTIVRQKEYEFVKLEHHIQVNEDFGGRIPYSVLLEEEIQKCRKKLFEECIHYMEVDSVQLLSQHIPYQSRAIKISLHIGNKK